MYYNAKELQELLREYANEKNISYKYVVTYFLQEEFLRRIMNSGYAKLFVLRGSYLVYQMTDFEGRIPLDLDFVLSEQTDAIENILDEILASDNGEDVVNFSRSEIRPIERQYNGYCCQLTGCIGNLKHSFKVNIGAAQELVHEPEELAVPVLLDSFAKPIVNVCSIETVIAEKFDRILRRFELTDCMKDLYDIFILSGTFDFDGYELQRAVSGILSATQNDSGDDRLAQIVILQYDMDFVNRWQHFCRTVGKEISFEDSLNRFEKFLSPIWKSIHKDTAWKLEWSGVSGRWEDEMYLF